MKRVLFVDEAEAFGGSLVVAGLLVEHLATAGWPSTVFVPFRDDFIESRFAKAERVVVRRPLLPYTKAWLLRERIASWPSKVLRRVGGWALSLLDAVSSALHVIVIAYTIVRYRIAVVHSNNSVEAIVAGLITGRPVVFHLHGFGTQRRVLLDRCTVVAVSDVVRAYAVGRGLDESRVHRIYNGIEVECLGEEASSDVRQRLGIPADAPIVGLVGRVIRWKGQKEFVEAASLVSKAFPSAYFLLIGGVSDGEPGYFDEVMALASTHGLAGKVICTGYTADVNEYLREVKVLVHASIEPEPFGLVIVEGMAMKKAVIASIKGAGPELIEDGVDGFLVDPNDAEWLAERVVSLLENPMLAKSIGERAARTVAERFSAQTMAEQFRRLYLDVIRERRGRLSFF